MKLGLRNCLENANRRDEENMEVPIFLFNGLLEAGKTAFIESLLEKPAFADGKNTLVISCEEGIEEYNKVLFQKNHITLVNLEEEAEFTAEFLQELAKTYEPQRVVIEFNGMWNIESAFDVTLPENWFLYQSLVLVNGETFELYMNNMRSLMVEHFKIADLVIINRCTPDTNLALLRGTVKSINGQARLFTSSKDFVMEPIEEELPYDLNAEVITVEKGHYGIWYIDLWDHPEHYMKKKLKVKGLFFQQPTDPKDCFHFGRFAMPCCEDDIAFMGLYCKNIGKPRFQNKDSIELVGEIRFEPARVYEGDGPVFYVKSITKAEENQEDMVAF